MTASSSDLVFYFGNSPAGGGNVRLMGYLRSGVMQGCTFVVHDSLRAQVKEFQNAHNILFVRSNYLNRLFNENSVISNFDLKNKILFSHGAPINVPCKKYVLHINNALPFVSNKVTLDLGLKIKMLLLEQRLKKCAKVADVLTVESEATHALVAERWGEKFSKKCKILTNGVDKSLDSLLPSPSISGRFALVIGAYSYKRLDLVMKEFRALQKHQPDLKLVIVGTVPTAITTSSEDVTILQQLPHLQVRALLLACVLYITMSEIENCSIALLEAIHYGKTIVCSPIPSHVESLEKFGYTLKIEGGVAIANPPKTALPNVPEWKLLSQETVNLLLF